MFAPLQELSLAFCGLQQLPPWLPKLRGLQQVVMSHCDTSQREVKWSECAPALHSFTSYCGPMLEVGLPERTEAHLQQGSPSYIMTCMHYCVR